MDEMIRPIRYDYYGPKQGRGKDAKLLVDVATALMDQRGLLSNFTEKGMQRFCEEMHAAFDNSLAAPAAPTDTK